MNKQELLKEVKGIRVSDEHGLDMIPRITVLYFIEELDEPQKVVIPQFVADKIEYCKSASGYGLFHAMDHCFNFKYLADWLESNEDIFARAWLNGYIIEKEKLYTVEIPNPNEDEFLTVLAKNLDEKVFIDRTANVNWKKYKHFQLTESEIRKDFEWAWDEGFAKEVE